MLVRIKRLAWKEIPWLYCIGAVLFVLSWLIEKPLEHDFTRKREELERLQRHISSNHNIAQLWFSHMLLLGTQEPKNSQAIAFASLWYMEFTVNALQSAGALGNENVSERKKFAEMRQSELDSAKTAFQDGQYAKVMSMASHLRTVELQWAGRLASANLRHFDEIESQRNFWGWLVRVFYVVGAGLIGFAFIRSRLHARNSAELTTIIDPPR